MTLSEKRIWNEAVLNTLKEVNKWDGIKMDEITSRLFMITSISKKLIYKIKKK